LLRQIKSVLNQRGYGASLPDRIKHTEKEINTLKKLLVLFNYNKTLMSRFLYRYYWKHFKNEESVRKYLEEYGIKKPWYNTKLTKKQRESCQKIFYEHYIMESIDDLGEYFRKNQTDKTIQDITVRWILAKPEKIQDLVDKLAHTK
jgi:acyl-homoserine lactone acylase PvdQ